MSKFKKPVNSNYCATIVQISAINKLDNCDNVVAAIVSGYQVIVDKNQTVGDIGIFFPVETELDPLFLKSNNLYRDNTLNMDEKKKGYIEKNGRLKCLAFRGHKSEGIFLPLPSVNAYGYFNFRIEDVGSEFDELDGKPLCKKYIPKNQRTPGTSTKSKGKQPKKLSRLVDNQFRLHYDTNQLKKNAHLLKPTDFITISNKLHGTSWVVGKVLTKRTLNIFERILSKLGVLIQSSKYDIVYSSRSVIKNAWYKPNMVHYYGEDIWGMIAKKLVEFIPNGFTLYGEAVGYTEGGKAIQKGYHYGCNANQFEMYVYRITFTNDIGQVFELDFNSMMQFCNKYGIKHVPLFWMGYAKDLFDISIDEHWNQNFVERLDKSFNMNDQMCELNNNEVPAEGCVVRIENVFGPTALKLKNYKFLTNESKEMDSGSIDIETQESLGERVE